MKKVLIAPNNLHKDLLAFYRQKDPFSDVKIMSKESLIGEWKGKVEPRAFTYLMKKYHFKYDYVKALFPYLPYINEKLSDLYKIKQDLTNEHLLIRNEYLKTFFLDKEILIYGYHQKDKELLSLLNHFGLKYEFITNNNSIKDGKVYEYESAIDEVFYTLNEIASLIENGKDINDIYILCDSDDYSYYLEKFSESFGYSLDIDLSYPLFETPLGGKFIKEYNSSKDIISTLEAISDCEDIDLLDAFKEVINGCVDTELDFDSQLDLFIGELKDHHYGKKHLNNVVRVINKPIFKENAEVFVLNFVQGLYPKAYKDNKLLSDKELNLLDMNDSSLLSEINEELMKDFFKSNNNFHFSFAHHSLTNRFFISPWANEFDIKSAKPIFPNKVYSSDMKDFYYAKAIDLKINYSEITPEYKGLSEISDIPYGKYNNEYQKVNVFTQDEYLKYSYSQIDMFYKCPFQYYVSRVLGVDPFEENFYTKLGTVVHALFEHYFDNGFDLEKAFVEEVEKQNFLPEELPIVMNLKTQIEESLHAAELHLKHMKNPKIITEKNVLMKIGPNSGLTGKIDKSLILDNKYLAIVDYKTGNASFNPKEMEYGGSLQLPTYCLLANNDKDLKDYQIMGVFINNVIDTSLSHEIKEDSLINPQYRLNGKIAADVDVISYLDDTIGDSKCEFIKGVKLSKGNVFAKNSTALSSFEELKEYADKALEKYKEADTRIRNNDFPINPQYKDKNNNKEFSCSFHRGNSVILEGKEDDGCDADQEADQLKRAKFFFEDKASEQEGKEQAPGRVEGVNEGDGDMSAGSEDHIAQIGRAVQ